MQNLLGLKFSMVALAGAVTFIHTRNDGWAWLFIIIACVSFFIETVGEVAKASKRNPKNMFFGDKAEEN